VTFPYFDDHLGLATFAFAELVEYSEHLAKSCLTFFSNNLCDLALDILLTSTSDLPEGFKFPCASALRLCVNHPAEKGIFLSLFAMGHV
jgi:hypothetical protein